MARFEYKVKDMEERVLVGSMDGATADEIIDRLAEKDLIPINVTELNFDGTKKGQTFSDKFSEGWTRTKTKVPYKDVVFFTRQLATMVAEGVPLAKCLEQLAKGEKPTFQKIINEVAADIATGYTFSDAVAKHPGAFNNMFVSVSRSGEVTGHLDRVLYELAEYMENVEILKSKVKTALRYPTFIGICIALMVFFILWKLVPVFEGIYSSVNATLPLPTQILLGMSHVIQDRFLWVMGVIVGLIALIKFLNTKESFKLLVHKYILLFPIFGPILKKNILATFCRTMGLLLESGTPILQAVEMSGAVVNNKLYSRALEEVHANLKQGDMLSTALEKTMLFPILVLQLVSTGEISGKVDELLRKSAEFYEREIRNTVDSLASIIEPVLIIILGVIVGGILISLYLPIMMIGTYVG
ncbi:MAG: type II secretion system F family protein [Fibrobacteria bacterium]|nr:type II secretion system F family protein [Fibrobacteria bacterium]